jgi:hypothetical protein
MFGMERKNNDKVPDSAAARDRYFGMILEDLNGKFSLLLEGYGALNSRMARIEERMEDLEKKFEIFRAEANAKFDILFEGQRRLCDGQQEFFEAIRQLNGRVGIREGS